MSHSFLNIEDDLEPLHTRPLEKPYASSEVLATPLPPLNVRLSSVTRRTSKGNQRTWVIPSFRTLTPLELTLDRFSRRFSLLPSLEHVPPSNNTHGSAETAGMRCRFLRGFLKRLKAWLDLHQTDDEPEWKPSRAFKLAFASMTLVTLCCALQSSSLTLTLPAIVEDLHGTSVDASWTGASFLLASAVSQPVVTSLSMLLGRKLVRRPLQSGPCSIPPQKRIRHTVPMNCGTLSMLLSDAL